MLQPKRKVKISLFARHVYRQCRRIPRGRVTTYGDLAASLGQPGSVRAVGQALHRNPFAPQVPCHRVVRQNGEVGGYASGSAAKKKRLRAEGITILKNRLDLKKYRFYFHH